MSPDLLAGVSLATFAASGVFFLKFWRASRDRFYLYFCVAFWLLSLERVALYFTDEAYTSIRSPQTEANSWVYLIRLAAFSFILIAFWEKNKRK